MNMNMENMILKIIIRLESDLMEDIEYNNKIECLKKIGENPMSESNMSLTDYSKILNDMFMQYGEEKVKRDLEIDNKSSET